MTRWLAVLVAAFLAMVSVASGVEVAMKPGTTLWGTCRYLKRARLLPVGMTTKECERQTIASNPEVDPVRLTVGVKIQFPDRVPAPNRDSIRETPGTGRLDQQRESEISDLKNQLASATVRQAASETEIVRFKNLLAAMTAEKDNILAQLNRLRSKQQEPQKIRSFEGLIFPIVLIAGIVCMFFLGVTLLYRFWMKRERDAFRRTLRKFRDVEYSLYEVQEKKNLAEKMCEDLDRLWEDKYARSRKGTDFSIQDQNGNVKTVFFPFEEPPSYKMPCGASVRFTNIRNHLGRCGHQDCLDLCIIDDPNATPERLKNSSQRLAS